MGFMVLILPGAIPQLIIAFSFSLIFMLLVSTAQPFNGAPAQRAN